MAAGPLACRLWQRGHVKAHAFDIEQGFFMTPASGSQLLVRLDVDDFNIRGLAVGGRAARTGTREIELRRP